MWNMLFTLSVCGVFISAVTENNSVWFVIFNIAMYICAAGVAFTHEKQEEKIENLEKQIKELVGEDK